MVALHRALCGLVALTALTSCTALPANLAASGPAEARKSARYSLLAQLPECPDCTLFTADGQTRATIEINEVPTEVDIRFTINIVNAGSGFVANMRYEEGLAVFVEQDAVVTVVGNLATVSGSFGFGTVVVRYNTDTDAFSLDRDLTGIGGGTGTSQLQFDECELPPLSV